MRIWVAPEGSSAPAWRARMRYVLSPAGLSDFLAMLAMPIGLNVDLTGDDKSLFCIVWSLKYVRYSEGLAMLGRVIVTQRTSLVSVLTVFLIVLLLSATLVYVLERHIQPEVFHSIPAAMWWAIVTLTTTGYGDVTPQTVAGRMVAGVVMVSGIAVFAMWAGILASGFSVELRRRDFLRTWDLCARVPLFRDGGLDLIADIVHLLRIDDARPGKVLMRRGQDGDCMYFIVSGRVRVEGWRTDTELGPGDFFGEMALLSGGTRSATVTVLDTAELLVLDVVDFRDLAGKRPELVKTISEVAQQRGHVTA
ncbi:MAG: cyclic nucleotide-binding domain-containing protein [Alphaproteobacteria bacterium]|nr:cyclic nucleotide-binding domain-containing protein [Alphaproteobacteria bacterium]